MEPIDIFMKIILHVISKGGNLASVIEGKENIFIEI